MARRSFILLFILLLGAALASRAHAHGSVGEPIAAITRAIAARPGDAGLHVARAELFRLGGQPNLAAADLEAARRLDPDHPALPLSRAATALDAGRAAESRALLDQALAHAPGDPRLLALRAHAAATLGDLRAAVADLDAAVRHAERPTPDLILDRARIQAGLGDLDGALRGLDEARARLGVISTFELAAVDLELALGRPEAAAHRLEQLAPQFRNPDALTGVRARIAGVARGETRTQAMPLRPFVPAGTPPGLAMLRPARADGGLSAIAQREGASPAPARAAGIQAIATRGPYLQMAAPAAITVRWRTDVASDSRVRWGTEFDNPSDSLSAAPLVTDHELRITGLAPATRYYYTVGNAAGPFGYNNTFAFVTPPLAGTAAHTRIWIVGDSGLPGANANAVRNAYAAWTGARGTDLWLMLGDNAYNAGTDAEYEAGCFDQYQTMLRQAVLWPTRGNHDVLYGGANNDYYDFFTMPTAAEAGGLPSLSEAYYSFDRGNVHFVCLDSEGSDRSPGGAMLTWLANDLAANIQPWVIAFFHHPPYTKGSHDSDNIADSGGRMRDMRENALPILEAGGADLVLTGHSHSYERTMLLNGHYGTSGTLTPAMKLDPGDGQPGGDGPYFKSSPGPAANQGTVNAVVGSSSRNDGGALNHPAMISSIASLGSMALDIAGLHLEARFLNQTGAVLDSFVIDHGGFAGVETGAPRGLRLAPGLPNPFALDTRIAFVLPEAGNARLTVVGADGRRLATIVEGRLEAGPHEARWDGRDGSGRALPAGIYFAVLEAAGTRVTGKLALVR